jgi:hypothetical protein
MGDVKITLKNKVFSEGFYSYLQVLMGKDFPAATSWAIAKIGMKFKEYANAYNDERQKIAIKHFGPEFERATSQHECFSDWQEDVAALDDIEEEYDIGEKVRLPLAQLERLELPPVVLMALDPILDVRE